MQFVYIYIYNQYIYILKLVLVEARKMKKDSWGSLRERDGNAMELM